MLSIKIKKKKFFFAAICAIWRTTINCINWIGHFNKITSKSYKYGPKWSWICSLTIARVLQ